MCRRTGGCFDRPPRSCAIAHFALRRLSMTLRSFLAKQARGADSPLGMTLPGVPSIWTPPLLGLLLPHLPDPSQSPERLVRGGRRGDPQRAGADSRGDVGDPVHAEVDA